MVSVDIAAPLEEVWAEAIDFACHAEWMKDACAIRFEGDQREGVGTVLLIETQVGPFRTVDRFEITEVVPMVSVAGQHAGIFTGEGRFELSSPEPGRTRFAWREWIRFPWYFGGPVGAWAGRLILTRVWRSNLAELKRRIEENPRRGSLLPPS